MSPVVVQPPRTSVVWAGQLADSPADGPYPHFRVVARTGYPNEVDSVTVERHELDAMGVSSWRPLTHTGASMAAILEQAILAKRSSSDAYVGEMERMLEDIGDALGITVAGYMGGSYAAIREKAVAAIKGGPARPLTVEDGAAVVDAIGNALHNLQFWDVSDDQKAAARARLIDAERKIHALTEVAP